MIDKLQIKNFQSHENNTLQFSSGVNVVIGQSDVGKSSIIRALRWVIWNKPSGDAYRSDWGGDTSVKISLDDKFVKRVRTGTDNYYKLKSLPPFRAIKTEVPKEIQDVLQIGDVNLQQQFDGTYLLSSTPGMVAAHFNTMAHLQQIDIGIQQIQRIIRELTKGIEYEEEKQKDLDGRVQALEYIDKLDDLISIAEATNEALKITKQDEIGIDTIIVQIGMTEARLQAIQAVSVLGISVEAATNTLEQGRATKAVYKELAKQIREIINVETILESLQSVNNLSKEVEVAVAIDVELKQVKSKQSILEDMLEELEEVGFSLQTWKVKQETKKQEYHKAFPNVCPLCKQAIKK